MAKRLEPDRRQPVRRYADSDTYAGADTRSDSCTYADPDPDAYACSHPDTDSGTYPDADACILRSEVRSHRQGAARLLGKLGRCLERRPSWYGLDSHHASAGCL